MNALINSNLGHYKNNMEYQDFLDELIMARQSQKPHSVKENAIKNFQQYNNERLALEEKIKKRVTEINQEIQLNNVGDKCMKFYSKQKLALERAYTRENLIKENILKENSAPCSMGSDDGNNSSENDIIAKINELIKSKLGHYKNNTEYNEHLITLAIAKISETSLLEKVNAIKIFQQYNHLRLALEEKIKIRVTEINHKIELNDEGDKCMKFYSKQKVAFEGAYTQENLVKEQILKENSASCPFGNGANNSNMDIIIPKIDALIDSKFGHYINNKEYSDFLNDLIIAKESRKSLSEKKKAFLKFQKYNNRRLKLEVQMEDQVSDIIFEIESLPKGHECIRFYAKQKLTLERSYTKKNSMKEKILSENKEDCPFSFPYKKGQS
ncbi:uncharacterized protein LOC111602359 isoform X2 [Drosophila hydei]|nr:uncharacterized protein LOC111602359 isoform X2 [Drosophila hydei]